MSERSGVYIYYARVPAVPRPAARYLDWFSAEERARYERFYFDADRQVFLTAHALQRLVLGEWAQVDPSDLQFDLLENGKPVVAAGTSGEELHFNLSHTRGLVACAVSRTCPLGVDVEGIDAQRELGGVARRILSATEYREWKSRSGAARVRRFFEYWTLKEAYIKALGVGLEQPLREVTLTLLAEGKATLSTARKARPWLLRTYEPVAEFLLSVAFCPPGAERVPIQLEERTP